MSDRSPEESPAAVCWQMAVADTPTPLCAECWAQYLVMGQGGEGEGEGEAAPRRDGSGSGSGSGLGLSASLLLLLPRVPPDALPFGLAFGK